jgi:ribosomal-protein-alanine N-acetyltransferase
LIDFGFRTMELNRIEAPLGRDDVGPRDAVMSMGMRHEGTLRKELLIDGSFLDLELYATLREEWPGLEGEQAR